MTTDLTNQPGASESPTARVGRSLKSLAVALLLVCISSRCFLMELPFAGLGEAPASAQQSQMRRLGPDRGEIARVTFAVALLGACAVWFAGSAIEGRLKLRGAWLAIPMAAFVLWSLASVGEASNKRLAVNAWLEQASLLSAGLLAVQLFAGRRRFLLLLVVLGGVGGALAVKAVWQMAAEIPDRISDFDMYRDQWLERFGWRDGSPQAALIESRIRDRAPTGFFGLANLFGSMLILLAGAAIGLACAKLADALGWRRTSPGRPGEVDVRLLAGILTALLAAGVLAALAMTASTGAIAAFTIAAAGGAVVWVLRRRLAGHWRACVITCALMAVIGLSAMAAYAIVHDRLPTKTMTFRWYYWRASAKVVADKPLLGAGPGNFPAAYLRHRRAAAEEEIKMPHNAIVHAACQYGLPGGMLYLTVLGCFLIGAVRPLRRTEDSGEDSPAYSNGILVVGGALLVACAALGRLAFAGLPGQEPALEILFEVVLPAGTLAVCLLAAGWWGERLLPGSAKAPPVLRVAASTGLVAFALHNMVTFSLWVPTTALVFWTLAGACFARSGLKVKTFTVARWPVAILGVAVTIAAAWFVWRPVAVRTGLSEMARTSESVKYRFLASDADPLDADAAADVARAFYSGDPAEAAGVFGTVSGYEYALEAIRRDPDNYAYHRLAAEIARQLAPRNLPDGPTVSDAIGHMLRAVQLNPMDARLRIDYAEMLAEAGMPADALNQADAAEVIDLQLLSESVKKLNHEENRRLESLRSAANRGTGPGVSARVEQSGGSEMLAEIRDPLEFLFPDSAVAKPPAGSLELDVARAGTIAAHILLNGLEEGQRIRFSIHRRGKPVPNAEWYRLIDVPVEVNTGPKAWAEKKHQHNPHVIRRAPFRVYDAMEPVKESVTTNSATLALRVHVPIPRNSKPERRGYEVLIDSGGKQQRLLLSARIYKPIIPPVGADSFPYTIWPSLENMADRHGLERWSEAHWRMMRKYADTMVHARQNTFMTRLHHIFTVEQGRPVLDASKLKRHVRLFTSAGMHFIEGGHMAHRPGGKWDAPTFDLAVTGVPATSPEGDADMACMCRQLMAEIRRNGWQDRWIQHVTDEPIEANATDYRILTGMAHKYMPGIKLMDATVDTSLVGSVNIWCPHGHKYEQNREQFEAFRQRGDSIWFYTCCRPGGPWLNRLLDMELLRPALLGWYAALHGLDGFLHYGLNRYKTPQHPFEASVGPMRDDGNQLPPGDGYIVYPGPRGPWSSLRLEAQREGLEDYELLRQLAERDPKQASRIVRRAVRKFDDYTKNVRTFRAARRALLEALH